GRGVHAAAAGPRWPRLGGLEHRAGFPAGPGGGRTMKLAAAVLLLALASVAVAAPPRVAPLAAADVPTLLQPPARGARIIALWALDCVYCEPTLRALAALQEAHPETVELVTVATDSV